ncbi:MAG: PAS domain S-box protein, partial [Deltaproteobacteria bacterium]|nr:PAS domain S-box protein [Deltaproteobacteria bacterium]
MLIVWLLGGCIQAAAETEAKKVVVLFPEGGWATPANQMIYSGLKKGFNEYSKETITLYANNLDLSRFPGAKQRRYLAEFYRSRYAGEKIDLVIPVYREAYDFVLENRDVFFPGVPIVFCAHFVSELSSLDRKDDLTGVAATLDITGTIDLARNLHPGLKRIAVIAGTIESDRHLVALARQAFKDYQENLEWLDLTELTMNDLLEKISLLPESTVILYLSIYRDGAGKRFLPYEALQQISSAANVPVYNIFDSNLGYGTLGGYMLKFEEYGNKTAQIALRILSGEESGAIDTVVIRDNPAIFDWREMRRWGIAEKDLPPGSIVRYKYFTVWDQYKWWIMGFIVFSCIETLLIAALLITRRKRRQIEKELRDSEFHYRTVADFTYDWEYWQSPDGTFRYISPSCKRITGYDRDAFADNPSLLRQIILPEYQNTWDLHHQDSHSETGKDEIQFRIRRLDGEVRWIEHVCQPVWSEEGTFLGLRGNNRDITDRKQTEISLQKNKDRFEILSGITHQLL